MFFLTVLKSLIIFKQGCCIFSLLLDCVYCVDCPSYPGLTICSFLLSLTEKAMTPHSSTLAWKTPWMEEPGRLQSMGSLRVGHDWTTSLSLFTSMHWRRKWKRTPVFLPGESRDGGAWWAAVYGVSQSQTWLKRLSSSSSNCPWIAPLLSLPPSERGSPWLWGSKPTSALLRRCSPVILG